MDPLALILTGDPIPKGRPRMGKGRAYTPARTRKAEKAIVEFVTEVLEGREPVSTPVGLSVTFYCATRRRTDGDNLLKLVTDAMNGLVYADDSQIEDWRCRVHRGVGADAARTELLVWELDPAVPATSDGSRPAAGQ